jgi:sulfate-transporting ATPase
VIEFKRVSKSVWRPPADRRPQLRRAAGAIVGIIGPNGAGKSTLFKMITGQEKPDSGRASTSARRSSWPTSTRAATSWTGNHNVFQEISGGLDILNINGIEIQSRAYIGRFNFKGQDQQKMVGTLSGGERGRLHLAKTLLQGGNVLLLDEPSNDLDIETLRALEDALLEFPAMPSSSRMTAGSWTASPRTSSPSKATRTWSSSRATTANTKKTRSAASANDAAAPHRLRYKKLA